MANTPPRQPNNKLKQERLRRKLTHAQLADLIDIADPHTISRWERGTTFPSAISRQKLCEVFNKTLEELGLTQLVELAEQLSVPDFIIQEPEAVQLTPPISASSTPIHNNQLMNITEHKRDEINEHLATHIEIPYINNERAIKNRIHLIEKVHTFWIVGLLEYSLQQRTPITLELENQVGVVADSWHLVSPVLPQETRPLSSGTRITKVYDTASGELLILGQPGSGKTTLLLELARDLLIKARKDECFPIPVILNLSSWGRRQQALFQWVVDELYDAYQVPKEIGRFWIENNQLALLLDGFDEVHIPSHGACIQAINLFHQKYNLIPLVICSRSQDYLTQSQRVTLNMAITIQSLTQKQIEAYLVTANTHLDGLYTAMQKDVRLRQLATSPLMLSILALTYEGKYVEEILSDENRANLEHIFANYTERMYQHYQRRSYAKHYKQQQIQHALIWLATQLKKHNQTEFYLERMQVDWLPEDHLRRLHRGVTTRVVGGLVIGLNNWESFFKGSWSNILRPAGLIYGLVSLLLFCCIGEFLFDLTTDVRYQHDKIPASREETGARKFLTQWFIGELFPKDPIEIRRSEQQAWIPMTLKRTLLNFLRGWLVGGILLATAFTIIDNLLLLHQPNFFVGLAPGLLDGSFFGIIGALVSRQRIEIRPAESIHWSWHSLHRSWLKALINGLAFSLILGLILGIVHVLTPPYNLQTGLLQGFVEGLIPGCISGLIYIVFSGLHVKLVDVTTLVRSNEGIRRSFWRGLIMGIVTTLIMSSIIIGLWLLIHHIPLTNHPRFEAAVLFGLSYGCVGGLIIGLLGGLAYIEQMILRFFLSATKNLPYKCLPFLNACVDQRLLCKIGGGYIFIHRLLLEYYSELGKEELLDNNKDKK